jgi:HlyD family secretion protein
MKSKRNLLIVGAIAVVVLTIVAVKMFGAAPKTYTVETAKIGKGSICQTVTATGTIEAINTVEVGTQVSGVIDKIFVDYNSNVKKGQLLAQIDETPLLATLEQSKSSVDQAEAEVKYQKATYERNQELIKKELISQSDNDLAEYNYKKALASLANAKSVYEKNRINLSYARITSPIDGIIMDRAVDEGQTVAASFNTPTLFTIANDLTQMRVETNIDEADIGLVKMGQRCEFTVDAFPDAKFNGEVTEIRLQPTVTSNVVTYTVVINAPNPDKKLMPGMTANTTIYVKELNDILVVPGKAVRFSPTEDDLKAYMLSQPKPEGKVSEGDMPTVEIPKEGEKTDGQMIWVKKGTMLMPVHVKLGDTDGINHQMVEGLNEGDELVTALTENKETTEAKKASGSPFMPRPPKR